MLLDGFMQWDSITDGDAVAAELSVPFDRIPLETIDRGIDLLS